jgi:flagellar operon protein
MNVRDLAARVQQPGLPPGGATPRPTAPTGDSFAETLRRLSEPTPALTLSAHAAERIEQRGIPLSDADRSHIADALRALDEKGSQDALLLRADAAFIVNVPNRTVVTALGQADLQDRVFTGIDSAFVLDPATTSTL